MQCRRSASTRVAAKLWRPQTQGRWSAVCSVGGAQYAVSAERVDSVVTKRSRTILALKVRFDLSLAKTDALILVICKQSDLIAAVP